MDKPSIEEVVKYAKPIVLKLIGKLAYDLPAEHKEEIEQDAYLRLMKAYDRIDPEMGWKSFAYNHCEGAVMDYLKFGRGFHEDRWSISKPENEGSRNSTKIRSRLGMIAEDGSELDIDQVLGVNGAFSEHNPDAIRINWYLVARLAGQDKVFKAFAKWVRGMSIEEIGPVMNQCRSRVGQEVQEFIERFDDPNYATNPYFMQQCYALGICHLLGMPTVDQGIGYKLDPVDLDDDEEHQFVKESKAQMTMDLDGTEQKAAVNQEVAV